MKWTTQVANNVLSAMNTALEALDLKVFDWKEVGTQIFAPTYHDAFFRVPTPEEIEQEREFVISQQFRGWKIAVEKNQENPAKKYVFLREDFFPPYLEYLAGLIASKKGQPSALSIVNKRGLFSDQKRTDSEQKKVRNERQRALVDNFNLMIQAGGVSLNFGDPGEMLKIIEMSAKLAQSGKIYDSETEEEEI
jgi:hypothetical protein